MSGLPRHSAALPHVCDATVGSALQLSWSHGPPKPTPHAPEAHEERSTSGLHSRRALATSSASRARRLGSQAAAAGDATGDASRDIIAESCGARLEIASASERTRRSCLKRASAPMEAPQSAGAQAGEVLLLHELDAELRRGGPSALRDRSVRVLGQLVSFDAEAARAVIEHGAATLAVDTSALLDQPLVVGAQLQFIGELAVDEAGEIVLTARVARGVGDLDLELFGRALAAKREFERELAMPAGAG